MSSLGYADALLGGAQMGANYVMNKRAKSKARDMDAAKRRLSMAQRGEERYTFDQALRENNRNANTAQQNILSDANERGLTNSSIPAANSDRAEAERARRYEALTKRQDVTEEGYRTEDTLRQLGKGMQRLQETQQLINSLFNSGASGAAAYYSGSPQ